MWCQRLIVVYQSQQFISELQWAPRDPAVFWWNIRHRHITYFWRRCCDPDIRPATWTTPSPLSVQVRQPVQHYNWKQRLLLYAYKPKPSNADTSLKMKSKRFDARWKNISSTLTSVTPTSAFLKNANLEAALQVWFLSHRSHNAIITDAVLWKNKQFGADLRITNFSIISVS